MWYLHLNSPLIALGFTCYIFDAFLFFSFLIASSTHIYVLLYVDDILITSSSPPRLHSIITNLQSKFAIKDLDGMHYFLVVETIHVHDGLYLSQHQYIHNLLDRTSMLIAKLLSTPMSTSSKVTTIDGHSFLDVTLYQSIVGSLQYLTLTRPDVSFAVNKVCQYMQNPCTEHWIAVKHILMYFKQAISFGLLIRRSSKTILTAFPYIN